MAKARFLFVMDTENIFFPKLEHNDILREQNENIVFLCAISSSSPAFEILIIDHAGVQFRSKLNSKYSHIKAISHVSFLCSLFYIIMSEHGNK